MQRNERRENAANRRQRQLLVMKRERCSLRGGLGWWRREGRAARHNTLYLAAEFESQ